MRVLEVTQDFTDVIKFFLHKKLEIAKETEKIGEIKEVKDEEYPPVGFFWLIEIKDRLKIYKANFY